MGAARKYPLELVERGVRMVLESGRPVAQVARDLGMHPEALRLRVVKARAEQAKAPVALDVQAELRQLRKRNAELERSNQILREATALFAAELDQTRRR